MSSTTAPIPGTIPALDSVRFIGVLAVVLTHVGFHSGAYTTGSTVGFLLSRLSVGVAIFFVLSGFLLSREWLRSAALDRGRPPTGRYYWKRFWRIMPAYVVVASVCLIAFDNDRGWAGWATSLALVDPFTTSPLPTGLGQTWSLSTEMSFYLVLPILMAALAGSARRLVVGTAVLALASPLWLVVMEHIPALEGRPVGEWLPAYTSWFAAGIFLAAVHTAPSSYPRSRRLISAVAASPGACWALAGGLLLISATPLGGPWLVLDLTTSQEFVRHVLYLVIGVLVIVPAAFGDPDGGWVRFLSHRAMRHLGHISYSVFLVHMGIIQLVLQLSGFDEFGGHFWPILLATLALSLPAAELLYRLVERPLTRVGRATRSTTTPSAAATSN